MRPRHVSSRTPSALELNSLLVPLIARRLPPPLAVEQFFKVLGEFEAGETEKPI